ncbi:MAG: hypothetical protein HOE69_06005 [Euryarchaeota archaeon]|mgnify:CR=1 FL=1|nr:hypothetical protein [Euryarchaeota archaeon]
MGPFTRLAALPEGRLADVPSRALPIEMESWVESLPEDLLEIVSRVAQAGGGIWLVGGSVREGLAGLIPKDYDLATDLEPDNVMEIFPNSIDTGSQYGTVSVRIEGKMELFEVTTLRCDQEYRDGRRPDSVDFGTSLLVDLERRDLTINAMAVDLARGQLYDQFGGFDDLQKKILRAVGDASLRLAEDGLRLMRVYRFMDQSGAGLWLPDAELEAALRECQQMLANVSAERIWQELKRILAGQHAAEVLQKMSNDGILSLIFSNYVYDLTGQSELNISDSEAIISARLAMLFGGESPTQLMRELKMEKSVMKEVMALRERMNHLPDADDIPQLRLYRAVVDERLTTQLSCDIARGSKGAKQVASALENLAPNIAGNAPLADGNWIVEQTGLTPGIKLGRLKSWLHRIQVVNDISSLDELSNELGQFNWQDSEHNEWPSFCWP